MYQIITNDIPEHHKVLLLDSRCLFSLNRGGVRRGAALAPLVTPKKLTWILYLYIVKGYCLILLTNYCY